MQHFRRAALARWHICFLCFLLAASAAVNAAQIDIHGPSGSVAFGSEVAVLPNGNYVVCDANGPVSNIGAVYLYGADGHLISTLTGATQNDQVCNGGIVILGNNFLVISEDWNNVGAANAGAVTWVNGVTGLNGIVTSTNSLVGAANDSVRLVYVLANGNYVVSDPYWHNVTGAVAWGSGSGGTAGVISAANSFVGVTAGDFTGMSVTPLSDGNYVVGSEGWSNGTNHNVGAATWLSGSGVSTGFVSTSNSLVGTSPGDGVGRATALQGGHYVVGSFGWHNAGVAVGAATWRAGGGAVADVVSTSNSLYGTSANDNVGADVSVLSNGNYLVSGSQWNGLSGAAIWSGGGSALVGPLLPANALTGNPGDRAGVPVTPLTNGNVVIGVTEWSNGTAAVGATALRLGGAPITGQVSPTNALVGTSAGDLLGSIALALSDGNYVVVSPSWNVSRGAATWGNGTSGVVGPLLPANSLTGSASNESLANAVATDNGTYAVANAGWNGSRGAVTWCRAGGITLGVMAAQNSLAGTMAGDAVGKSIDSLADGNYVVRSPTYHLGSAVTLASGRFRLKGAPQAWNSVFGAGTTNLPYGYDSTHKRLIVGRPTENIVSLFTMDQLFADDFDP